MYTSTSKHVEKFKSGHASTGEVVLAWVHGCLVKDGIHRGALIATDRRVVFYRKGFFGNERLVAIDLAKVASVERRTTASHRQINIKASGSDLEFRPDWAAKEQALCEALDQRLTNR